MNWNQKFPPHNFLYPPTPPLNMMPPGVHRQLSCSLPTSSGISSNVPPYPSQVQGFKFSPPYGEKLLSRTSNNAYSRQSTVESRKNVLKTHHEPLIPREPSFQITKSGNDSKLSTPVFGNDNEVMDNALTFDKVSSDTLSLDKIVGDTVSFDKISGDAPNFDKMSGDTLNLDNELIGDGFNFDKISGDVLNLDNQLVGDNGFSFNKISGDIPNFDKISGDALNLDNELVGDNFNF
jgi:hypothetical protein